MAIRVSVAMAVYNGEKYIGKQLDSILCQLNLFDELVISVDPCEDKSKEIAMSYASVDSRIRVYDGPGKGVIKNYETALKHVEGDFVFLSDQDDVWLDGKVERVLAALEQQDTMVVLHNASIANEDLCNIIGRFFGKSFNPGILKNIVKNRYIGCCMAFRKELLKYALPFPDDLPMHDQWLGLLAKTYGGVSYIDEPLILYRRHQDTVTGREKAGMFTKARWRVSIIKNMMMRSRIQNYGSN